MILRLGGRRIRIETLPPAVAPRLEWDRQPQAQAVDPWVQLGRALAQLGCVIGREITPQPRRGLPARQRHGASSL